MTGPSLGVVGGGAWGTALAAAAASAGNRVVLWLRDGAVAKAIQQTRRSERHLPGVTLPDGITATTDAGLLADADAVLLAVPAQSLRATLAALAGALPGVPLVICAKGIERETGLFLSEVVSTARPDAPVLALSGPSFAADVARGLPTALALAGPHEELASSLSARLSGPALRVYWGTDLRGVEIGGAAKNVLAIAAGIVDGRGLGESAKAALVARGFAELLRFAAAHGGRPETLMGLSGLGDLVLTCGSAMSRNFALGMRLGAGLPSLDGSGEKLAEGAFTASALTRLAREAGVEMPVADAVDAVLAGRLTVDGAVDALMRRPLRAE